MLSVSENEQEWSRYSSTKKYVYTKESRAYSTTSYDACWICAWYWSLSESLRMYNLYLSKMISYVELANYTSRRGSDVLLCDMYSEDGVVIADACLTMSQTYVRLQPVGIGQLWRQWVDMHKHNVGKLLSFMLGRAITVYGYIHIDRPKNGYAEYPMFVGAWLDYRDVADLMQLQYSVGFYTNGVFCFNREQISLTKNIGFPNNPVTIVPLKSAGPREEFRTYTYSKPENDPQMQWVYDVHAYLRDHFKHAPWPPVYNVPTIVHDDKEKLCENAVSD